MSTSQMLSRKNSEPAAFRLPHDWIHQIDHLAQLQCLTRSEQLRELIRFGGEHVGLELE
ncbi:MAG: hypothetical protein RLZZ32_1782 [Cyanobacteriota bacterium]|jgi:predicted DNA-binding protein